MESLCLSVKNIISFDISQNSFGLIGIENEQYRSSFSYRPNITVSPDIRNFNDLGRIFNGIVLHWVFRDRIGFCLP